MDKLITRLLAALRCGFSLTLARRRGLIGGRRDPESDVFGQTLPGAVADLGGMEVPEPWPALGINVGVASQV